ncbi:hypothetical protein Q5687_24705 [Microcoleus sp. AT10_D2]|uniref:hypothetical protein n=1 Tax=unclassified Microcoleus TaxID=2642155 RepID=UPI002FD70237
MYALAQNFLARILDAAAAAEILSGLHLFFTGISPKIGISIYCSLWVAIAQKRYFIAAGLFAFERKNNLFLWWAIAPRRSQNPGVSSLRRNSCSRRKTI